MQFIDLNTQYQKIKADVDSRIQEVFTHGKFVFGPEVSEFEQRLAEYVGVKHCITISNGTMALWVALQALDIKPGDEVITTPFTFIATAEIIALFGAKPVFVDIDPKTYNIDPSKIEQAITAKTKCIMPVDIFGQCADYDVINQIAAKYNLPVIEDAAQSMGATYKGRQAGGLATIGCTSFFPAKPLGCYGEGGACFVNDDALAEKINLIHNHGQDKRYHHAILGINARLSTMQAAVLLAKLDVFAQEVELRQKVAAKYNELLADKVKIPYIASENSSAYAQYTIQVDDREKVRAYLQDQDIPTAVHYPIPLHKQPVFTDQAGLNIAETVAAHVLSLPFYPYLETDAITRIAAAIIQV